MAIGKLHTLSMIILALLGVIILFVSLAAANRVATGSGLFLSGNKIYFGRKILPDHLLYPVLMVHDRLIFVSATKNQQALLRLSYANDRFESAEELLKQEQLDLAITTLTKSQKYLMLSGLDVLNNVVTDQDIIQKVLCAIDHSIYRLQMFQSQYQGTESIVISNLIEETKVLQQQLEEKLTSSANQS